MPYSHAILSESGKSDGMGNSGVKPSHRSGCRRPIWLARLSTGLRLRSSANLGLSESSKANSLVPHSRGHAQCTLMATGHSVVGRGLAPIRCQRSSVRHHCVIGPSSHDGAGCSGPGPNSPAALASTNKCLAQSTKPRTKGKRLRSGSRQ